LAAVEGARSGARARVGRPGENVKWAEPAWTVMILIIQTNFKRARIVLTKGWTSKAPKIQNKIFMERAWDKEQLYLSKLVHIRIEIWMKIQGSFSRLKLKKKNHWKILELWISTKFGQQAPAYTLLLGKIHFYQKRIRNLNSIQKGNSNWFHNSLNPKLYYWNPPFDLGSY
jgi:hypothetical protein